MNALRAILFGLSWTAINAGTAAAEIIAGQADVIDGNTIRVADESIRLLEIDAPELDQGCVSQEDIVIDGKVVVSAGSAYRCGEVAKRYLAEWIESKTVSCIAESRDTEGYWLAHCTIDHFDIGLGMVMQGMAVADRDCQCYGIRGAEEFARKNRRGIWLTDFKMPWDWRQAN